MSETVATALDALAGRRVFFAHQSVGANILDGLRDLMRDSGRDLRIAEWGTLPSLELPAAQAGVLWHAKVGPNEQPLTKCDEFRRLCDQELSGEIDIALLKFCYVDINDRTDVAGVFDRYRQTLRDLAARHPAVTFVAVTAPLRLAPGGVGTWVRERLGRPNRSKRDNLARHGFNLRVREEWAGTPLFDLAAAEATRANGRRETFSYDSATAENLVGTYTDDGGHLNAEGRRAVAEHFVRALAAAAALRRAAPR